MANPTGVMTSIGTTMGAGETKALYSWTKGRRWRTLQKSDPLETRRIGEADVRQWRRPGDGKTLVIAVAMQCPSCLYPLTIRPKSGEEFNIDEETSLLHYRAPVECPAHWAEHRDGVPTGRTIYCNWKAVIIEGRCHQINGPRNDQGRPAACPCANPQVAHTPYNCTCGGYPTDEERAALINPQG